MSDELIPVVDITGDEHFAAVIKPDIIMECEEMLRDTDCSPLKTDMYLFVHAMREVRRNPDSPLGELSGVDIAERAEKHDLSCRYRRWKRRGKRGRL